MRSPRYAHTVGPERAVTIRGVRQRGPSPMTAEQVAFINEKLTAGLTNVEVARQVFRHFGRDCSASTIRNYRQALDAE